jgi:hypothetical protein
MPSEKLASAENALKGNLASAWNILEGSSGDYTDLGIARRFGGAAAAGSVVRVRREPNDTTTAIDDEEIFSANQVQSGALEDWVNGKLESTLPADVATAAAAYSLRKVKASYTEDAVRIRRIDNTEVDVAFDSDGKVSTNSSITNVGSGDIDNTAETTLGNFLQGEADVRALFNSSAYFPTDSDYFSLGSGLTLSGAFTISYDVVFTGSFTTNTSRIFQDDAGNDLLTFTASNVCKFRVNGTVRTMPALSTALQLGRKYSMIFARDGSGNYTLTIDGVQVSSVSGSDTDDFLIQRIGFRNRGSISNININSGQHIYAGDGAENSNWTDTGSGTITNATKVGTPVAFTGQGIDSFVDIWYDQAGSNDAVQATAGNQPKIAENGALLTDENGLPEIKFTPDASNGKFLSFTTINFSDTMGMFFKGVVQDTGGSARTFSKDGSFTHIIQFLNSTSIVINTTTDATFTVPDFTTRSKLHTLLTASDSANYFGNAATADSPQAVDMNSNFQ